MHAFPEALGLVRRLREQVAVRRHVLVDKEQVLGKVGAPRAVVLDVCAQRADLDRGHDLIAVVARVPVVKEGGW